MVDMLVVAAVVGCPVEAGVFKGAGTKNEGENPHRHLGLEGKVRKQTMISDRDAHHGGSQVKEEKGHQKPVGSMVIKINRKAKKGDQGGADQKRAGCPVDSVKGDAIHVLG